MNRTKRISILMLLGGALVFASCRTTQPPVNSPGPVPSPKVDRVNQPFSYAGYTWPSQLAFVQSNARCATISPPEQTKREVQERIASLFNKGVRPVASVEISVAFHVITKGPNLSDGHISKADIDRQIDVLNQTYGGKGGSGAAATSFKFTLGGFEYTLNQSWFTMVQGSAEERAAKTQLQVPGKSILNLYTGQPRARLSGPVQSVLGFATFPWDYASDPVLDGVVIAYDTLPKIDTTSPYDLGFTGAHETGHWLGLYHTFEGGCSDPNDYVDDTPQIATATAGCPNRPDTCPNDDGPDQIENFMDYSDDVCMFEFTAQQSSRMDAMYITYRQ